jgi:hypothetical protein
MSVATEESHALQDPPKGLRRSGSRGASADRFPVRSVVIALIRTSACTWSYLASGVWRQAACRSSVGSRCRPGRREDKLRGLLGHHPKHPLYHRAAPGTLAPRAADGCASCLAVSPPGISEAAFATAWQPRCRARITSSSRVQIKSGRRGTSGSFSRRSSSSKLLVR